MVAAIHNSAGGPYRPFRDPLTFDTIVSFLDQTVFSPFAFVWIPALTYVVDKRAAVSSTLYPPPSWAHLTTLLSQPQYKWAARALVFVAIKTVHNILSRLTRNHGVWRADPPNWKKDVVVITGGSQGIGKATVEYLSQEHKARIAVIDFAAPTYRPAPSGAPEILYFKADVTDKDQIAAAAKQIREKLGKVTYLVNCAGVANGNSIVGSSIESATRVWRINTGSFWVTCNEFVPEMIKQNHGHVVTVASSASYAALPRMSEYAVSKAGALAFHEVLSQELRACYNAPRVRTSIVCPTKVNTAMGNGMESAPSQFFTPTLEPEQLGRSIGGAIQSGLSHHIITPGFAKLLPFLRVVPDHARRAFGIVGNFDKTVSDVSTQRALKAGYGTHWEGEDKAMREKALADSVAKK